MDVNIQDQKVLESDQLKWLESNPEDDVFMNGLFRLYVTFEHLKNWGVGHDSEKECTVYAYRNIRGEWVNAKRVKYNEDLKRDRNVNPYYLSKGEGYSTCLYGEHQLTDENRDKIVILVEAEKSAIVGSYIYPEYVWLACGGSNGLTKEKARVLKGRKILIMMDADEPGRKSAEKSKAVIESAGGYGEIFDLFPDRDDGTDVADVIIDNLREINHAFEDLDIIKETRDKVSAMKPERPESFMYLAYEVLFGDEAESSNILKVKEKLEQAISRGFQDICVETKESKTEKAENENKTIFNIADLENLSVKPKKYLWEPYLQQQSLSVLAGKPDSGKSLLMLYMAMNIAQKKPEFLGYKLNPIYGRSLFVETEDYPGDVAHRCRMINKGLGQRYSDQNDLRLFRPQLYDRKSKLKFIEDLKGLLRKTPVDLVVISSFGDVFLGSDIKCNMQMRENAAFYDDIACEFETVVVLIHHVNKIPYGSTPQLEDLQGGSGLGQKARSAFFLKSNDNGNRYFSVLKGNNMKADDTKNKALELKLDSDTLCFSSTGKMVGKDEYSSTVTKKRQVKDVDWERVFSASNELSRKEIVTICKDSYSLSRSAIDNKLKEAYEANILTKKQDGLYALVKDK